jgi:AhpD family alkylhydroperoxidase
MADQTPWYAQNSPQLGRAFNKFYQALNEDSVLDDKTRELLMAALACAFRCPQCTEEHIEAALEPGASRQEVTAALLVAAVEGAGTQLYWCKDIYEKHLGGHVAGSTGKVERT